jgi:tetratricopeptide (TPR) repeat protein
MYDESSEDRDLLARKLPSERYEEARFWTARRVVWLLAMPLLAAVLLIVFGEQIRSGWSLSMASWHSDAAARQMAEDNLPGALESINKAIEWAPDEPQLYLVRAQIYAQHHDLPGHLKKSLDDYDHAIEKLPKLASAYRGRAMVHRQLGNCEQAIDDLTQQIELAPRDDPYPLNDRAYVRALCGMELEAAQTDIDRAIEMTGPDAAMLDTRGYIYYLRDQLSPALEDMARAIEWEEARSKELLDNPQFEQLPAAQQAYLRRALGENLAVMHHHRGLIHEKLGNVDDAQADFAKAQELGYDPSRGVE